MAGLPKMDNTIQKCSNCHSQFKDPKLLPCFHIFCKSPCLEKLVVKDHDGKSLTCPTCHHHFQLPDNGVSGLQTHQVRKFKIKIDKCENCKIFPAEQYCKDCSKFKCTNCTGKHEQSFPEHKIVGLSQGKVELEARYELAQAKKVSKCAKHLFKQKNIFCNTCSVLICIKCTLGLHKDHNYDMVDDIFPDLMQEIVSGLKPIKEKLDNVRQALEAFNARAKDTRYYRATVEADIHKESDQLHQLIDQRRVELVGSLDLQSQQKLKELATQRGHVEKLNAKMSRCLEYAESGLKKEHKGEILTMKTPVLKQIEHITTEIDSAPIQPQAGTGIKLAIESREELYQACREFGEIVSYQAGDDAVYEDTVDMAKKKLPHVLKLCVPLTKKGLARLPKITEDQILIDYLHGIGRTLKFSQLIDIATKVARIMVDLEKHGFIHRDLAARSVTIGANEINFKEAFIAKVDCKGLYTCTSEENKAIPIKWTAPEAMTSCGVYITIKSNVWSFGILLYEIITFGRFPYPGKTNMEVFKLVQHDYRMPITEGCPEKYYSIMCKCWEEIPANRPTFETLHWQFDDFFTTDDQGYHKVH